VRTGRAHPGLLENLLVDADGDHVPIKACGSVTVRNPQLLAVVLFDTSVSAGGACRVVSAGLAGCGLLPVPFC
jgi:ribosome recycling factor